MTERVTVMNLRSFSNYYKLRSKSDAQPEIRQIAELMLESIIEKNICPIAIKALSDNNWSI
jgi:thymidylate synthase ThyX